MKHQKALAILKPRLEPLFVTATPAVQDVFFRRLDALFEEIVDRLLEVYVGRYDFFYHLERILHLAAESYLQRPADLQELDARREAEPLWFQSEKMMGGVAYVDLFADNLAGIREKLPYFKELGLTYLHLMPLFKAPAENSDGGYAVSDFREVNPALGSMAELADLAALFRQEGISLCLDFVFNHTSDEHEWALKAQAGDADYADYFLIFPDRTMPDQYEQNLREIFPEQAPGSFTYRPDIDRWVWTTFNTFQWDLNYANPEVFAAMLGEMLFLANQGVEVLRMDAVAFIWKKLGTMCEGLPEAHYILQALNALVRLAAPAMIFKSEAIVHPAEVEKYFGMGELAGKECPISYNPTLMALLWEALATREVRLLHHSMVKRFPIPANCAWVNYVRVHDDIGWSFADEDAIELGIQGFDHRQFLNKFYSGTFPGSFANGLLFNFNPITLDARISGTCASLAGLETAQTDIEQELAIRRILLIHSVMMSIGGIPLLYLGDEVGTINDYSFEDDPGKAQDNRWVHRPRADWEKIARRKMQDTVEGRIFQPLVHQIQVRKNEPAFAVGRTQFVESGNPHIFSYIRWHGRKGVLILCNFSERAQDIETARFRVYGIPNHGVDRITGQEVNIGAITRIEPYQYLWIAPHEA